VDEDPREGRFVGTVSFGPTHIDGVEDEEHVTAYRIYAADSDGERLGAPLAEAPRRAAPVVGEGCCSGEAYRVRVEADLTGLAAGARLLVVTVVGSAELPVAAPTAPLQDVVGLVGVCASVDCAGADGGSGYVLKISPPAACAGEVCTTEECCEPFGDIVMEPGQAGYGVVLGVVIGLLVCVCGVCLCRTRLQAMFVGRSQVKDISGSMSPIVPDGGALTEVDIENAVAAEQERSRSVERARRAHEVSGIVARRLEHMHRRCQDAKQLEHALSTLLGLLQVVQDGQSDDSCRRIDKANEAFAELFAVNGIEDLLGDAGFQLRPGTTVFVLRSKIAESRMGIVVEGVEARLAELRKEQALHIFPGEVPPNGDAGDSRGDRRESPF